MHADTVYALAAVRSRDLTTAALGSRRAASLRPGWPAMAEHLAQTRDRWSILRPAPVACCA